MGPSAKDPTSVPAHFNASYGDACCLVECADACGLAFSS